MNAAVLGELAVEEADDGTTALQILTSAALRAQRLERDRVEEFEGDAGSDGGAGDGAGEGFRNNNVN